MLGRALQLPSELAASAIRGTGKRLGDLALTGLDAVLASRIAEEAVDRALASRLADHTVERVFDQEHLIDETVTRLIESEELWVLVDSIAKSPAVTEAIARQSVGFADQVAEGVRERSERLDMRLERAARRIARRPPRPSTESP